MALSSSAYELTHVVSQLSEQKMDAIFRNNYSYYTEWIIPAGELVKCDGNERERSTN